MTGTRISNLEIPGVLDLLSDRMEWDRPFDRGTGTIRRGRGLALGLKACISPTTSVAIVHVYGDGSCAVHCGTVDMGQGSDTVMAQVAGEVLGIRAESVQVLHPDTSSTPYDMGTLGSRSTFHMGHAVRMAALSVRAQLLEIAGRAFGVDPTDLACCDAAVVCGDGRRLTLRTGGDQRDHQDDDPFETPRVTHAFLAFLQRQGPGANAADRGRQSRHRHSKPSGTPRRSRHDPYKRIDTTGRQHSHLRSIDWCV